MQPPPLALQQGLKMVFTGCIPLWPIRWHIGLWAWRDTQGQQLQSSRKMPQQISGQGLLLPHDGVDTQQQVLRCFAQLGSQISGLGGVHGCPFSASGEHP
ncbi:hypothetical protein Ajs_0820 [Acidovorax sp. JS42]|nr:hypothetical protein Ajs_0820 [Acidovorax sp. JS42]